MRTLLILLIFSSYLKAQVFQPVSSGLSGDPSALYVYKNELYVGGSFYYADNLLVNYIARWNGTIWRKLEGGAFLHVSCFAQHNNLLYVGGSFQQVYDSIGASVPNTKKLAAWDGTKWISMGLPGAGNTDDIKSMVSYNGSE